MRRIIAPRNRLVFPRRFRKPINPVLDLNHPLSRGLVAFWPGGDNLQNCRELVAGNDGIVQNGPLANLQGGPWGGQYSNLGTSNQYLTAPGKTYSLAKFTIVATSINTGGGPALAVCSNAAVTLCPFYLMGTKFGFTSAASTFKEFSWSAPTSNVWHQWVGSYDGATLEAWVDGTSQGTLSFSGTPSPYVASDFAIGRFGAANGNYLSGRIILRIYNRPLNDSERRWLQVDPFAGTYEVNANIGGIASVSANANLSGVAATAAAGTFGFTLSASPSLTGVQAASAAGSFGQAVDSIVNLTGVSATAAVGTLTAGASASFALDGVQANAFVGDLTPVTNFLTVPLITIMNANPIPIYGLAADDDVAMEGDLPYQLAFEGVINTNPIPMTGAMSAVPVPGEGSVP